MSVTPKKQKSHKNFLDYAKAYVKRYLSHTTDYKKFKDNDYYYITVYVNHITKKAWADPNYRRKIKEIIKKCNCDYTKKNIH